MITYTQTTNDNARESEREGESGEEKTKKMEKQSKHAEKNPTILIGNEEILASFDANHGHL